MPTYAKYPPLPASGGGSSDSFKTINVPSGTDPVATTPTDILTLTSTGATITITGVGSNTINLEAVGGGGGITALTGDGTATGPGSVALTLATVNGSPGSFGSASDTLTATVNAKGLVTAMAATPIAIAQSQVTNLVTDLAGKQNTLSFPLNISQGGTNSAAALANNRIMRSTAGAIVEAAAITANRALISDANGIPVASAVTNTELGYVSGVTSAIQTQIDSKQATGNYITALTGDATATGPGSVALTLATVNGAPGSFGSASNTLTATVNAKGLVTAMAATPIAIAQSQVTNLVTDLAAKANFSFVTINTDTGTDPVADGIADTLSITSVIADINGDSATDTVAIRSRAEFDDGLSGATPSIDWNNGPAQRVTLDSNCTFTLNNPQSGTAYVLRLIVGGAGAYTVTWPATVKWAGGATPVITATVGRYDLVTLYFDGTNYSASISQNFTP